MGKKLPRSKWAAVHPKGVSLDEEFQVVHFDLTTGRMLGRVSGRSHQLGIGFDGSIYPATKSDTLIATAEEVVLVRPSRFVIVKSDTQGSPRQLRLVGCHWPAVTTAASPPG